MERERGILFVLSGPSGVGKGTVCKALRGKDMDIQYSVSATTRQPREGEVNGVDYYFKSKEEFQTMIANNELLEWAEYVGNYYGTPIQYVNETLDQGRDVILEIEVQGALQVRDVFPEGVFIFLTPPSLEELRNRIVGRGTETEELINNRMNVAREEIEMMQHYDYSVVNDQVDCACDRIQAIITSEHCKVDRVTNRYKSLLGDE
ncbi:guanylate kinase [Fictibacillus macauensis ZFHKF-1]|uniref:Guanylate kinase n=1 Tax=Fictibacillus macauensis ZFHKF-1 TaxID=1196324 RepID=I8IZX3_9BACL|nr:guanylate kinase [Fictibacillus macauensis]EIT85031.1 guanylate kinase [Fictibacillus macauensis ZFHKF-1]